MAYPVMPLGFLGSQGDNDTYRIERSLRFNSADSAYLNRTAASATNQQVVTLSFWVKRSALGSRQALFSWAGASTGNNHSVEFTASDTINIYSVGTAALLNLNSSQVFRDPSSWYHIIFSVDTTQATASNRLRLYVNGVEVTSFGTATYPSQNASLQINSANAINIGRRVDNTGAGIFNGYLTEINFIDGQALTPSSFGETDALTGRWKAKAYSGTYGNGTNGFYLKFADNSGTTATTLGKDSSGNGNNWTPNNFSVTAGAGNDSLVDSPTNYGTDTGVGGEVRGNYATLNPVDNNFLTLSNGNLDAVGSANYGSARSTISVSSGKWYFEVNTLQNVSGNQLGIAPSSSSWSNGNYVNEIAINNTTIGGIKTVGVTIDFDNLECKFYVNNVLASTQTIIAANAPYSPFVTDGSISNNASYSINFGQRPFTYTAPTGFRSLCTTNLPTPTIRKPSSAMDVVTYTGNGSARSITGLGFSPDLVWIKSRSGATDHAIYDSVRGVQKDLGSNLTTDETTQTQGLTAFNSDGFDIGTLAKINTNTSTYVAWAWDRAAIDGLDIVSYTGNGANRTISHNLGVAPKMIIVKARTTAGTDQGWPVYHASLANTQYLLLNSTAAAATGADYWNSTSPTASVFSLGTNVAVNANNDTYIAYLFSEVEGFSKFGSYTGNGSSDGPLLWCGSSTKWVLIKRSNGISEWHIFDSARDIGNETDLGLYANGSNAEASLSTNKLGDFLSNGIKLRGTASDTNGNAVPYIFAAFAESPFKYARAR